MATIEENLFTWRDIEARSDLDRFYLVRDFLPDEQLVQYLETMRGQGRDDYPVVAMWNAVLAGVVFQHPSIEALIRELGRNPALLEACGFDALPIQRKPVAQMVRDERTGRMTVRHPAPEAPRYAVPGGWNFSRFLANVIELEECLGLVTGMIATLREQLMDVLPDFGRHLGYDGKAVESHSTGRTCRATGETSDPDADWGKHETAGINARTGKPWKKIKSWFGYGVHLIADTEYEIPVAVHLTPASTSEQTELRDMIRETFAQAPELADRCDDFSGDRGLDSAETKALLWDDYAPSSTPVSCGATKNSTPITTRPSPSPVLCIPIGWTPSSTPRKAASIASARTPANSATLPSRASSPIATPSSTAVRLPPTGLSAKGARSATKPVGSIRATMAVSCVSASTTMIGASLCRLPTAAPAGSAATTAVAPWSGLTTASITASASSGISSAAWRKCRPVSAWPWRS